MLTLNQVGTSASLTQGVDIQSNQVANITGNRTVAGIAIYTTVGAASVLSQNLTIKTNDVSDIYVGTGFAVGIGVVTDLHGTSGSSASGVQTVDVSGNTVSGVSSDVGFAANFGIEYSPIHRTIFLYYVILALALLTASSCR